MKSISGFKKFLQKFWVRKDREVYLLSGVILATVASGFITAYWHYADRMEVVSKINIDLHMDMNKEKEFDRFKEAASYSNTPQEGTDQYYKIEEESALSVPKLSREEPAQESELTTVEPVDNDLGQEYSEQDYQDNYEEN
jgi:preprotein translocase subunit SecF